MFKSGNASVGLFLLLFSQIVLAGTAAGTLSVTANVADTCTVAASGNLLAFGAYTGAVNNASGSIRLTCTDGDTYTVALNAGSGSGASFANRVLTNPSPAGTLNYNIYTTTGRTVIWGDGTGTTATVTGMGNGAAQTLTPFGQIPAGQTATVTPGNYTDTVTITVTFSP
jgi:spore coat protein U domain-containing protein, fimbrial subunit CupE1/2/3/6